MVTARVRRAVLLALLTLLALPHAAEALTWGACADFSGVRCATVTVPLDRTGADSGQVALRLGRIGKSSGRTLMYLSGGPGGAGVEEMVNVIPVVPALMRRYRVIGYDQRGTGRSGLLRCPALERDPHLRDTAAAEQCASSLGAARRHYTTPDSVQDMEAIRQQLGVDKLTLFGISYGTELALAYARTFPSHVDRLIIDSVVDPDDADPFVTASFRAMAPSLDGLCPARCRGISADPVSDLYELVKRLRTRRMRGLAYDAKGRSHKVAIGPTVLMDLMFNADYDPPLRAAIPAAVRSALAGDPAPLARIVREANLFNDLGSPRDFSTARYATICEEAPLPWDPGTPLEQRPAIAHQRIAALGADAFKPFDAAVVFEDEIDLCLRWPDVPRPPSGVAPPPYPSVPTLLLQGGEDLRTPPEISARVAARIPGSKRLVVPGVGHGVTGSDPTGCAERALVRFVDGGAVPSSCRRVPTYVPGVVYAPAGFDSLPGFGTLPRRIGRTLRALEATFDDLRFVISPAVLANSGGGLRGGSWAYRARRISLRGYTVVRGVTLTGGGSARLVFHVRGSKAAHGTVALSTGGRLRGTLGGRRISVTLGTSARASKLPARASRLTRAVTVASAWSRSG
jgi:pimeloyl-ACP methyl ester carboxylesterase